MFVKRFKIRYDKTSEDTAISIPIKLDFTPIDNSELVEDKFVRDEVEKAINPIVDYKKVRFKPAIVTGGTWNIVDDFKLQSVFLVGESPNTSYSTTTPSNYDDLGFTDDDIFCRTNSLTRSYMTLSFFDSPVTQSNRLLYFNTIFTQIEDDQKEANGIVKTASLSPISYVLGDPTLKPRSESEGFHIYWYQDLVDDAPNKEYEMYMTMTYNNAKTGVSTLMRTLPTPDVNNVEIQDIASPNSGLYLKVVLKYDTTDNIYKYTIQKLNTQVGVSWNSPIEIPTITFYQAMPSDK